MASACLLGVVTLEDQRECKDFLPHAARLFRHCSEAAVDGARATTALSSRPGMRSAALAVLGCYGVAASVRPGPAVRSAPHALRARSPCCSEPALPRRAALQLGLLATAAEAPQAAAARETGRAAPERAYGPLLQGPFDFPAPGSTRATLRRELVPGRIWSFEQVQGVIFVHVPLTLTLALALTLALTLALALALTRCFTTRCSPSCTGGAPTSCGRLGL